LTSQKRKLPHPKKKGAEDIFWEKWQNSPSRKHIDAATYQKIMTDKVFGKT
jgi:hypothetical protein